jgi:Co/Zn/Cd efflux system component
MATSPTHRDRPPRGRVMLAIFLVSFSLFALDVLLGKAVITFGWQGIPLLSDVAEFLLLLFAVTMFVMAALQRERERNHETGNAIDNATKSREE